MAITPLLIFVILFAAVFAVVWSLGPWAVKFCRKRGMMAPAAEDRHIHKHPTPHGGGMVLPMVVVPVGLIAVWAFRLPFAEFLTALLLASLPVAYVGWTDDHKHVEPRIRLMVHLLSVSIGLMFLPQLFDFMPLWLEKILLLLAWGWFVNLYNFMDGADGLATSEAIFISLALSLFVPAFAPLALIIAAAGLGFLRVNFPTAKVFMGDVASTWLGFTLGGLLLVACADDTWQVIWPLASITLVFCADATSTLVRRVATGHHPSTPHKTFWFHQFLARGNSHKTLLFSVLGVNIGLFGISWLGMSVGQPINAFIACLVLITSCAMAIRWLPKRQ